MREDTQIASSVVNGIRALLIDEGRWPEVERAALEADPEMEGWLEDAGARPFVSFAGHRVLLDVLGRDRGPAGLRALGRARFRAAIELGAVAPILRCWVRQYAHSPGALMRVTPFVWDAVMRGAGRLVLGSSDADHIVYEVADAPETICSAPLWHALLEGYGTELLQRTGRDGVVRIEGAAGRLTLRADWASSSPAPPRRGGGRGDAGS